MMRKSVGKEFLLWIGVLVATAVVFSFALACGMPFAALGALAALALAPRDAAFLVGLGWFANQVIGFGFLGYPLDVITLAWGGALGLSALAAAGAAMIAVRLMPRSGLIVCALHAFLAAWAAQQGTVFAASLVLGSSDTAFAPAVLWFIFWTNALAFAALLGAQILGARAGLARLSHKPAAA